MTRNSIEFAVKIFIVCLIGLFAYAFYGLLKQLGLT